jgi:hypothetical protein
MLHRPIRTSCVIDGCQRSTSKPYDEWICGPHWQTLTCAERKLWGRLKRRARFRPETLNPVAFNRIWGGLKRRVQTWAGYR